jgi:phenylpyruvate tautomerase PptA (4-oxalocrotonate tautomerase family)
MPLYTVMTQDGFLSAEQRNVIAASILGGIRTGHTSEEKTRPVQALWKMFQDNTGISDSDLSVALQDVPPSQAMQNGGHAGCWA